MKKLTQKVKELALANNLDYVGIADADMLRDESEFHRPNDYLPGAQTVISIGIKLTRGIQLANRLVHNHTIPRHAIYSYLWHGFGLPSLHYLDRTALLITRLLEKEGYLAVPVMAASTFGIRDTIMEFSNIRAAVAAGLGELGFSGLVLTPDVGPRARFGSIITTARLDTDPLYEGPKLCQPEQCMQLGNGQPLCVKVCPTHAIRPKETQFVIGDKTFNTAEIDRWRCTWGSLGLSKAAGGLKDIPMPDHIGPEEVYHALSERDPSQSMELMVIGRGDYCGQCIVECPVGSFDEDTLREDE